MSHRDQVPSSEWSASIVRSLQHIGHNKIVPVGPCEPRSNADEEKVSSASIKDYWKLNARQLTLKGKDFPEKSLSSDEKTKKLRCMWETGNKNHEKRIWDWKK